MQPLTFIQRRVLGVLIEKALATPDSYPLTLNAVLAGCNQKQNRDPVVEFEEGDVGRALHELMLNEFVRLAPVGSGARSNRFQHEVETKCHWANAHQAVMAELLLRGPQTVGELRTRASRMTPLADLAAVTRVLDELGGREPPQVEAMPREPGRSAVRYTHLLCPEDEAPTVAVMQPCSAPSERSALEERIARLEALVADLENQIADLRVAASADPGKPE